MTRDNAARDRCKTATSNFVINALLLRLVLRQSDAGQLRNRVDCRHWQRIHFLLEAKAQGMTRRDATLLHGDRGERWADQVTGGIDSLDASLKLLIHCNRATSIQFDASRFKTKTLHVHRPA